MSDNSELNNSQLDLVGAGERTSDNSESNNSQLDLWFILSELRKLDVFRARRLNRESLTVYVEACESAGTREVLSRVIRNLARYGEKYPLPAEIISAIVEERKKPMEMLPTAGRHVPSAAEEERARRNSEKFADQTERFIEACRQNSEVTRFQFDFYGGSIEEREKILADAEDLTLPKAKATSSGAC